MNELPVLCVLVIVRPSVRPVPVPANNNNKNKMADGGSGGEDVVAVGTTWERHHHHQINTISLLYADGAASTYATLTDDKAPEEQAATDTSITQHKRQRIPILSYKDNYVIVSKPAGMTMHRNSNSWFRSKQPVLETTIKKQLSRKPYLVHRLDHRTSGALLLAFNSEMAGNLHGPLVRGDLREKFKRAAAGKDDGDNIDLSTNGGGNVIGSKGEMPNVVDDVTDSRDSVATDLDASEYKSKITVNLPIKIDGIEKEAQTDFHFLSSMALDDEAEDTEGPYVTKSLSLLLCQPKTGRTHQIRRHAIRAMQSPIIGDSEHGDSRVNRFWREKIGFNRLGLHCLYLHLPSSSDNDEDIKCIAPLTDDFKGPLESDELATLWEEAAMRLPPLLSEPYDDRGGTFGRNYRRDKSENTSL
eukprot:scaffold1811_cov137-Skeletonema_marinoi.AAC.12